MASDLLAAALPVNQNPDLKTWILTEKFLDNPDLWSPQTFRCDLEKNDLFQLSLFKKTSHDFRKK